jgi:hypothetical protein
LAFDPSITFERPPSIHATAPSSAGCGWIPDLRPKRFDFRRSNFVRSTNICRRLWQMQ